MSCAPRLRSSCGGRCRSQRPACMHRGANSRAAAAHIDILPPPHGPATHPHRIARTFISGAARFIFSVYIIPSISLILSLRPSAALVSSEPACRPASRRTHHFPASLTPHTVPPYFPPRPFLVRTHAPRYAAQRRTYGVWIVARPLVSLVSLFAVVLRFGCLSVSVPACVSWLLFNHPYRNWK